jgi:hypothetical protein
MEDGADSFSPMFWLAVAIAAYAFYGSFRRWINGHIVRLADLVRSDTPETFSERETRTTHILEEMAFVIFEEASPGDPRLAGGWHNLPAEVRAAYLRKAIET